MNHSPNKVIKVYLEQFHFTMKTLNITLIFLYLCCNVMKADFAHNVWDSSYELKYKGEVNKIPTECINIVDTFADYASNFTKCSITNARPITLCAQCIEQYVNFRSKYKELLTTVVNGTVCKSFFISVDRFDVVLEQHDSISGIWNKGNCNGCYDWNLEVPAVSNSTKKFNQMYEVTKTCINGPGNNTEVCERCMDSYMKLNEFYKSLSEDAIGVDSVCVDIVDKMNTTRSIWSKTLNCCNLRRSPEIVFLCCTAIIGMLPILYYLAVKYCGPIRDLPDVLKQSRFKQMILRSQDTTVN